MHAWTKKRRVIIMNINEQTVSRNLKDPWKFSTIPSHMPPLHAYGIPYTYTITPAPPHMHPSHTSTLSHNPLTHTLTHPPHMHPSPTPGTIECSGANLVEQAENCHFQRSTREMCGAPAILILQGFNISEGDGHTGICECAYRGGRYVCTTGEWVPC